MNIEWKTVWAVAIALGIVIIAKEFVLDPLITMGKEAFDSLFK